MFILHSNDASPTLKVMLNKVPEVTLWFWVIKILSTTIGEAAADYLAFNLGMGLERTALVMGLLLAAALAIQLRARRCLPTNYWVVVVLVSIVGTLTTDLLTDRLGVSLFVSTGVFSISLLAVFAIWWKRERTLSIHAIDTPARERFYWLTVLVTFALGTAAGDLTSEALGWGYGLSALIYGYLIAFAVLARWKLRADPVLIFWVVFILTRPLGASVGDFLAQPVSQGGMGFGAPIVTAVFAGLIALLVTWLTAQDRLSHKGQRADP